MRFTFFSKTDKRPKQRFFNPPGSSSADDTSVGAGQDSDRIGMMIPAAVNTLSYRTLRLLPPKESLDDLLEKLLRNAENSDGQACSRYLEQMLHFLKRNPELVNRVPNRFHSNPLEVVIRLGDLRVAQELLLMKASVRPENRNLMKKIEHLLQLNHSKKKDNLSVQI